MMNWYKKSITLKSPEFAPEFDESSEASSGPMENWKTFSLNITCIIQLNEEQLRDLPGNKMTNLFNSIRQNIINLTRKHEVSISKFDSKSPMKFIRSKTSNFQLEYVVNGAVPTKEKLNNFLNLIKSVLPYQDVQFVDSIFQEDIGLILYFNFIR